MLGRVQPIVAGERRRPPLSTVAGRPGRRFRISTRRSQRASGMATAVGGRGPMVARRAPLRANRRGMRSTVPGIAEFEVPVRAQLGQPAGRQRQAGVGRRGGLVGGLPGGQPHAGGGDNPDKTDAAGADPQHRRPRLGRPGA